MQVIQRIAMHALILSVLGTGIGVSVPAFASVVKPEALLNVVNKNTQNVSYSQVTILQNESISYAGQVINVRTEQSFQTERLGSNTMVSGKVTISQLGHAFQFLLHP